MSLRCTPLKRTPFRRKPKPDPITPFDRAIVLARSGGRCEWRDLDLERCVNQAEHLHHKLRRRHGDHSPENLMHVCLVHHDWIHRNVKKAEIMGYLKRSTPVLPTMDALRDSGIDPDAPDA